jgi:hypothetical protein
MPAGAPRPAPRDGAPRHRARGSTTRWRQLFPGQPPAVLLAVVEHYKRLFLGRDAGGSVQPFAGARAVLQVAVGAAGAGLAVATGKSRAGLARSSAPPASGRCSTAPAAPTRRTASRTRRCC